MSKRREMKDGKKVNAQLSSDFFESMRKRTMTEIMTETSNGDELDFLRRDFQMWLFALETEEKSVESLGSYIL